MDKVRSCTKSKGLVTAEDTVAVALSGGAGPRSQRRLTPPELCLFSFVRGLRGYSGLPYIKSQACVGGQSFQHPSCWLLPLVLSSFPKSTFCL